MAWERNLDTNLGGSGDPFVHEQIALAPAGADRAERSAAPPTPRVVSTRGQVNCTPRGRRPQSMDAQADRRVQPRHRQRLPAHRVGCHAAGALVVGVERRQRPSAGRHLDARARPRAFGVASRIATCQRATPDLHAALPAGSQSVRDERRDLQQSWYDRRNARRRTRRVTDYVRRVPQLGPSTQRSRTSVITTGSTGLDEHVQSLIAPNFGDYTDNASVGTRTYFNVVGRAASACRSRSSIHDPKTQPRCAGPRGSSRIARIWHKQRRTGAVRRPQVTPAGGGWRRMARSSCLGTGVRVIGTAGCGDCAKSKAL